MRNPYWTVVTRAPFSMVIWSVFGFVIATAVITLTVPSVPQVFTFVALGMLVVAVIVWMALAIRSQNRAGADRRS